MLVIRDDQIEAINRLTMKNFEDRMVSHLKEFFPEDCQQLGETQVRETIRHGVQQASKYEVVTERDVCKYVDLLFTFGRDFDKDPQLPWAKRILNAKCQKGSPPKIARLFVAAKKNISKAGGLIHHSKKQIDEPIE